jgi:hypothetical protein
VVELPGDPVAVSRGWVIRRLSPEAQKLELASFHNTGDQTALMEAMGAELANVHAGTSGRPAALAAALEALPEGCFHAVSKQACDWTERDQQDFKDDPDSATDLPEAG